MKIERINENKIRVHIDADEAKAWNVSFKMIAKNTPEVQEMFWSAIRQAEKDVDFSVDGAKLLVEAVPSPEDEGFGMMITRTCSEEELNDALHRCAARGRVRKTELKLQPRSSKRGVQRRFVYRFSDFENLCAAGELIGDVFEGRSTLYKCDDFFYLHLQPDAPAYFAETEHILSEFSVKQENGLFMLGYLNEYGEVMIEENAVSVIVDYFCCKS